MLHFLLYWFFIEHTSVDIKMTHATNVELLLRK